MPHYHVHYVYNDERRIYTINSDGHDVDVDAHQALVEFLHFSRSQEQASFQEVLESHGVHISNIELIEYD